MVDDGDISRRRFGLQFGALSGALALAPAGALADDEPPAPVPLEQLVLTARLAEVTEHELVYELWGRVEGDRGLSVSVALGDVRTDPPVERSFGLAWLDDAHPLSRRMVPPPFVDVPAATNLVLARMTVALGKPQREAHPQMALHVTVRVWNPSVEGAREIVLPPLPVTATPKQG